MPRPEVVADKRQMYRLLAGGAFGNTIPQFFGVGDWERSPDAARYPVWGVRTLVPGGPCRLNCPRAEVRATCERPEFRAAGVNISQMIDATCRVTLWAEAYDSPAGLVVCGIEFPPPGGSWRALMPTDQREYRGTAGLMVLRRHLNANSLDDLAELRERFPGHVYEFSACDGCLGTVPHRNAVIWEVRDY